MIFTYKFASNSMVSFSDRYYADEGIFICDSRLTEIYVGF